MLTEIKKPRGGQLTPADILWNTTVQHDRARVEHLIGELVTGREALTQRWRGSINLLDSIAHISAHMSGLEERMKGPRYDVLGPWPVCPSHIVARNY